MRISRILTRFFVVLLMVTSGIYFGCNSKTDKPGDSTDGVKTDKEVQTPDNTPTGTDTTNKEVPVEEPKVTIPDLKGSYSGSLFDRPTTLKITEQTDSSFSGKITINYRETVNEDVKGIFSPTTMEFSMSDQIHNRSMGKYKGKISSDGKTLSGNFFPDYDKGQASFNLKKK
jgi:hypothetical protein